jgi:hypothetical protein
MARRWAAILAAVLLAGSGCRQCCPRCGCGCGRDEPPPRAGTGTLPPPGAVVPSVAPPGSGAYGGTGQ